jgi:hypothetical protein
MARQIQLRRGTTAQHATFTGAVGEVTVDTDKDALVVHDGVQAGGFPAARESVVTAHTGNTNNPHGVTKSQVGLGNVDNTSDANKPVSSATQSALNLKADLVSPTFTGVPAAPTADVGTSSTQLATTAFVNAEIANDTYSKSQMDTALAAKVDDSEIASVNLLRADKYLSAQAVANMIYNGSGKLIKVQYNNSTDVDYEVLTYNGANKLSNVAHYVGSVLKGNTVLSYSAGKLVSAIYTGV